MRVSIDDASVTTRRDCTFSKDATRPTPQFSVSREGLYSVGVPGGRRERWKEEEGEGEERDEEEEEDCEEEERRDDEVL